MSRLDVVIFGATGFTGKHAALEMARQVKKRPDLTWGVAGRSQSKLEDLMREIAETTGSDQSNVKIIIADVTDDQSLDRMCEQARVIANCCGPYRMYGEAVVRAAVRAGTHHLDVSGEPQFIETMQLKYDAEARAARTCVVSACGYDSVPNDMGVVFLQDNFGGTLNSVESYMRVDIPEQHRALARAKGAIHRGTWDSLVYSLAHWSELKPIRQKLFPENLPPLEPKLKRRGIIHCRDGSACVPFLGADNSIVRRTQRKRDGRPAQFKAYLALPGYLHAVMVIVGGFILAVMARFSFTRDLLLRHPRIFSGGLVSSDAPPEEVVASSSFTVQLHAEGWRLGTDVTGPVDKMIVARVSGMNPGYGATVIALILCAITVLDERDKIPAEGGVLTTGIAFKDTSLIKKLNENGVKFEIVETSAI